MSELNIEKMDGVYLLEMNRPAKHNALNTSLTKLLLHALKDAAAAADCRAIVLTGNGPSFCAGADTSEFASFKNSNDMAATRADLTASLHQVFSELNKPIVSAVHGNALGGGAGLAIACDMAVVEKNTSFGFPELRHGICPAIVMANLTHQLGQKKAFELISTTRLLNGNEMYDWGLANASHVGLEAVRESALDIARKWASFKPQAMHVTKRLFHRCVDLTLREGILSGQDANVIMRSMHGSA